MSTIVPDSVAAPASVRANAASTLGDFVALTKPRITGMVLATTLGGAWLARHHAPAVSGRVLALATIGTVLVVAGANVLNMVLERDSDGLMERTRDRPLPAGRMATLPALLFGLALSAVALPMLTFGVNAVTGLFAAIALVSYVLVYTPLKRKTPHALVVGAVPGAVPPLLGWTSVTGRVDLPAVLLFGVLFTWQVPHFLAIATFRRDDYARAGLRVLPVEREQRAVRLRIVAWIVALLGITLMLARLGVGGPTYAPNAAILGCAFLAVGVVGLRNSAGDRWARGLFAVSIVYLLLLFAALVIGG
jgi:protoheme IX farnesyltransferase